MDILSNMFESEYFYLFAVAIILLSTKVLGLASRRVHMPAVVGALLAGILLGPSGFAIVGETDFLTKAAEIGVIVLMFQSGLETDLNELKENGITSFIVAAVGVIFPLLGGALTYYIMNPEGMESIDIIRAVFIGVTLTATSVSITVETLREMGRLSGRMGTTVLGAAVIDDIIGIIVLTAITSVGGGSDTSLIIVLLKILLFFIFVLLVGLFVFIVKRIIHHVSQKRRISMYALAFCLIMSYCAEEFFGVADITGAYFAGIVLCSFGVKNYIDSRVSVLSYLFFSPIFFASIGIKTDLRMLAGNTSVIWFAFVLLIVSILTKILGCGLSAKLCKFNNRDALSIGIGMVSRGEVALIVAQKGAAYGLINSDMFPAIVFMVIVTTLITPVLLKMVLTENKV